MSNLTNHVESELTYLGYTSDHEDEYAREIRNCVLALTKVLGEQGHSGFSAPAVINLFSRAAMWLPLTPLTGADDEWSDEFGGELLQNKRCPHIFKNKKSGEAFNTRGIVFYEWTESKNGEEAAKVYFTNSESYVTVTFPYTVPAEPNYVEYKTEGV